jgi:hypothetical protein
MEAVEVADEVVGSSWGFASATMNVVCALTPASAALVVAVSIEGWVEVEVVDRRGRIGLGDHDRRGAVSTADVATVPLAGSSPTTPSRRRDPSRELGAVKSHSAGERHG